MNLIQIQAAILDKTYGEILSSYVGKQYGYLKKETGELVVSELNPISKKITELLCEKSELNAILKKAKEEVRPIAQKTVRDLKQKMGFLI
jgi:tryptophanyl-tRNA synthetase